MSTIEVADQTFVAAPQQQAVAILSDQRNWRRWWPDLTLTVVEDRAEIGIRWAITGPVNGTMELWLEPILDGFTLHYFMHGEPTTTLPTEPRPYFDALAALIKARRVKGKEIAFEIKDKLEQGRAPGERPNFG